MPRYIAIQDAYLGCPVGYVEKGQVFDHDVVVGSWAKPGNIDFTPFTQLLEPTGDPRVNPIKTLFRQVLNLTAKEVGYIVERSERSVHVFEDGGVEQLPETLLVFVDRLGLGPNTSFKLKQSYKRHRATLAAEVKDKVEKQIFPAASSASPKE